MSNDVKILLSEDELNYIINLVQNSSSSADYVTLKNKLEEVKDDQKRDKVIKG